MNTGLSGHHVRNNINIPIPYVAVSPAVMALDVLTITGSSLLAGIGYHQWRFDNPGDLLDFLWIGILAAAIFVPAFWNKGLYSPARLLSFGHQAATGARIWIYVFLLLLALAFVAKAGNELSRGAIVVFMLLGFGAIVVQRALVRYFLRLAILTGNMRGPRVAALVFGQPDHKTLSLVNLQRFGYRVAQYHQFSVAEDDDVSSDKVDAVLRSFRGSNVNEIFVVANWQDLIRYGDPLETFQHTPLTVRLLPEPGIMRLLNPSCATIGRSGIMLLKRAPLNEMERLSKRVLDVSVATLALCSIIPLLLLVAIAIKLDSPGPVLFLQQRNGFNGKPFRIFKFRSMKTQDDGPVVMQATRGDPRVTRVGYWLRRTSIDELPQLLNVIRGDMSIVGPRPHALAHDDQYAALIGKYAHRHHVKPGITGLAQVSGFRGETQTIDLMQRRVELDLRYIGNWNLWRDVVIIVRTGLMLIARPNAY